MLYKQRLGSTAIYIIVQLAKKKRQHQLFQHGQIWVQYCHCDGREWAKLFRRIVAVETARQTVQIYESVSSRTSASQETGQSARSCGCMRHACTNQVALASISSANRKLLDQQVHQTIQACMSFVWSSKRNLTAAHWSQHKQHAMNNLFRQHGIHTLAW